MEFETGSDSCNLWSSSNISRSLRKWVGERAPAAFHRRLCALLLLLLRPLLPPREDKIDMSCRFISPVALLPEKERPVTHWAKVWVSPGTNLDLAVKRQWKEYRAEYRQPTGLTSLSCHWSKVVASAGGLE
jgi:hypothetical protein